MNIKPGSVVTSFLSPKGTNVTVRYATKDDVVSLHKYISVLHAEDTFLSGLGGEPITFAQEQSFVDYVLEATRTGKTRFFVITTNGTVIGTGEIRREPEKRLQHVGVLGISLRKEYRDEGIGTQLMKFLIIQGKDMGLRIIKLTCFANNPRALHVYEKFGFRKVGVIPGAILYQKRYIDQVIMYLPLV